MANLGGRLGALINDRNLLRFVVQARSTGKQLGIGSYGVVEEVFMIISEKLSRLSHNLTHHTPSFRLRLMGWYVLERRSMRYCWILEMLE